jgi:hypothetical protein
MYATKERPTETAEHGLTLYKDTSKKRGGMLLEMLTMFRKTSELESIVEQTDRFPSLKKATKHISDRLSYAYETTQEIESSLDTIIKRIDERSDDTSNYEEIDKLRTIVDSENILPQLEKLYATLQKQTSSSHWKKKFKENPDLSEQSQKSLQAIENTIEKIATYKAFASEYEHALLYDEVYSSLGIEPTEGERTYQMPLQLEATFNRYKELEKRLTQSIRDTWFSRRGSTVTDDAINQTREVQAAREFLKKQAVQTTTQETKLPDNPLTMLDTISTSSLYQHIQGKSLSYVMNRIPYDGFSINVPKTTDPEKMSRHIYRQTKQTLSKLETTALQTSIVRKICTQNTDNSLTDETLTEMMSLYHSHFYNEENTKRDNAYMQTLDSLYCDMDLSEDERENITLFSFAYYLRRHGSARQSLKTASTKEKKKILADYTKETIQQFDTIASKYHKSKMQEYVNKHKQQQIKEDSLDFLRLYNHIDLLTRRAQENNKTKTTILFSAKDINPNSSYK